MALLALLLLFIPGAPALAQSFPQFTGLVTDAANVLPADRKAALETKLEALQQQTGHQLVVATIPDLQGYDIADYGYRLGRAWGVGLKGADNGAILIVAPGDRKVRIEVGYGLEPVLTDALSSVIIQQKIIPAFKAGDIPGGIEAGADALATQLSLPDDQARAKVAEAKAAYDKAHARRQSGIPFGLIIWMVILGVIVFSHLFRRTMGSRPLYRDGGSNWPIWLWAASEIAEDLSRGSGRGGGSSWGGGGDSGGGGGWGGGGFTGGGGGGFGGGGASGELVMRMNPDDAAKVAAAIRAAEAGTDGEISAIVAPVSDDYADAVLHWSLLIALLPLALSAARPGLLLWGASLFTGWEAPTLRLMLTLLLVKTIILFLIARYLIGGTRLRIALTPAATRNRRVRRRAIMLFRAGTEQRTLSKTGVLLYLSLAEHRAEIVADAAIHSKAPQEAWGEAMAALVSAMRDRRPGDGMAAAIERIGAVLAEHFPHTGTDPNELPDRLIEL